MNTYIVKGKDRQTGAIGALEPFEMSIKAQSEREARDGAIRIRYTQGRELVTIESCEFGGYDSTPMYFDTSKILDTHELKRAVGESQSPYFFSHDSVRFFRSRLAPSLWRCDKGVIFITSEQYSTDTRRLYTIRMFTKEGRIEEIGEFQQYESLRAAKRGVAEYLKG